MNKKEHDNSCKYAERGRKEFLNKNFKKAALFFNKSFSINPRDTYQSNISQCFLNLGELDKATQHISKALELNPHRAKYYRISGIIHIKKAIRNNQLFSAKNAIEDFHHAFDIEKNQLNR